MVTNTADDSQVRQYIPLLVNAAPPMGVILRNANAPAASAIAIIPPIPPALHKILAGESLN